MEPLSSLIYKDGTSYSLMQHPKKKFHAFDSLDDLIKQSFQNPVVDRIDPLDKVLENTKESGGDVYQLPGYFGENDRYRPELGSNVSILEAYHPLEIGNFYITGKYPHFNLNVTVSDGAHSFSHSKTIVAFPFNARIQGGKTHYTMQKSDKEYTLEELLKNFTFTAQRVGAPDQETNLQKCLIRGPGHPIDFVKLNEERARIAEHIQSAEPPKAVELTKEETTPADKRFYVEPTPTAAEPVEEAKPASADEPFDHIEPAPTPAKPAEEAAELPKPASADEPFDHIEPAPIPAKPAEEAAELPKPASADEPIDHIEPTPIPIKPTKATEQPKPASVQIKAEPLVAEKADTQGTLRTRKPVQPKLDEVPVTKDINQAHPVSKWPVTLLFMCGVTIGFLWILNSFQK